MMHELLNIKYFIILEVSIVNKKNINEIQMLIMVIINFCSFQFAPSMQTMLTFLLAGLATFHETYNRPISYAAASLATAPKYILFPEQRAKKVIEL